MWEEPLATACTGTPYDFVLLAYVTNVANGGDGTSASFAQNFANHCTAGLPFPAAPGLAACEDIAAGIAACHNEKKRVLISIGEGDPGLSGDDDGGVGARAAESMWDLYLGGNGPTRPFAGQTLDGVDLAFVLSGPPSAGFVRFASRLRELMNASGSSYLLTATPTCPFPDPSLGPGMGTVLGDDLSAFDALFVRFFYDSSCAFVAGDAGAFHSRFEGWATLAHGGRPKIFVGLSLVPGDGNVDRGTLPALISDVKSSAAFGGIVLRDESYDQNSVDSTGQTYGQYAKGLLP
jgi:chitinase